VVCFGVCGATAVPVGRLFVEYKGMGESMSENSAYLLLSQYGNKKSVFPLVPGEEVRIGRSSDNDIVLTDDRCSRYHATVQWNDGQWFIRDMGSRNGTTLNGNPLSTQMLLLPGSAIQIGHSVLLFEVGPIPGNEDEDDYQTHGTGVFGISHDSGVAPLPREFDPATIVHHRNKTSFLEKEKEKEEGDDAERMAHNRTKSGYGAADLCQLAFSLGSAGEVDVVAKLALEGLIKATEGTGAGLWLFPYTEKPKVLLEAVDLRLIANVTNSEANYVPISEPLAKATLEKKEAVLVNEQLSLSDDEQTDMPWEGGRINNTLAAPIRRDNDILGLIHLYTSADDQSLGLGDLEYTLAVADTVAVALRQLNRQKELTAHLNQVRKENFNLREMLHADTEIIGLSTPLKKVAYLISRAAEGKASLLIRGESGTGKELIAKAVHFASARRSRPLVCLNCAAVAESLLASELFGHEKGAFTGATERKIGKFEAAHTGTLFLDEIGEMPVSLQSKLLRVLEGHPFERVGGNTPISVDVRVIAATNRDLEREVAEGRFRHDLFFRLRVLEIVVPPLRKRTDDIPVLAKYFLEKYSKETGRKYQGFSTEAMDALLAHRWPGNVRELKNVVERSVVLGSPPWIYEQDLLLSSLSTTGESGIQKPSAKTDLFEPTTLEQAEKVHIQKTLEHTQWNKSLAARTLGIERTTLDRKIKRYKLDDSSRTE